MRDLAEFPGYSSFMTRLDNKRKLSSANVEYWMGRDIQEVLAYTRWETFEELIRKAMKACESSSVTPGKHFRATAKMVSIGSGAQRERTDYFLTRYACYLIAMNGEPSKPEVGFAQAYFAVQTRKQEKLEEHLEGLSEIEKRLELRARVAKANSALTSAAKQAGVQRYDHFHAAGYRGLYDLNLPDIRRKNGLSLKEDILDRAGRAELAANEFRITQAESKLVREKVSGQDAAIQTHRQVGKEVRNAIQRLGGTMPENLPAEESIKKIDREYRKLLTGPRSAPDPKLR